MSQVIGTPRFLFNHEILLLKFEALMPVKEAARVGTGPQRLAIWHLLLMLPICIIVSLVVLYSTLSLRIQNKLCIRSITLGNWRSVALSTVKSSLSVDIGLGSFPFYMMTLCNVMRAISFFRGCLVCVNITV